jgi:DNA-directed RNA polymerase specialized sigma24 family protein
MSDGADPVGLNPALVAEVEVMLSDGFVEGLVRRLRAAFPSLAEESDGAVGHAVEKLITRPQVPGKPRPYLTACAYNEMKRLARRRARELSLEALAEPAEDREDSGPGWQLEQGGWTVEEKALLTATYKQLRAHVETWETDNVRVVTLLYLEAAFLGEPLSSQDAAELAGDVLGYEVDDAFVRTWKSRGFKRLREFVYGAEIVGE